MRTSPSSSPYRPLLAGAALAAGLLALAARSSALLAVALGLSFFVVQAWWLARRGLAGVGVRRRAPASAFEDDMVAVDLLVENRSRHDARLVLITDSFGPGLADAQVVLEAGPLPPDRQRRLQYHTFCSRQWGTYTLGPLWVGGWDPMGLHHARRKVGQVEPIALYPRVHEVPALAPGAGRPGLAPEEKSAARAGQSSLYLGVRDYQPGDDVRSIHWPAMARRAAPMMREREVDLVPAFTLFLDLHREGRAGVGTKSTLEYVVRVGASLLWTALRRGQSLQAVGEGSAPLLLPRGQGDGHLSQALHELIHVKQDGDVRLADVVARFRPHLPAGSTAVLVGVTTSVDPDRLEEEIEALRVTAVEPLLILVDGDSFAPLDRLRPSPAEAVVHRQAFAGLLEATGVGGAFLGSGDDLAEALARPDFLAGLA